MKRRLLASLAATAAVATSLLISSAGPATAAAPEASASNVQSGGRHTRIWRSRTRSTSTTRNSRSSRPYVGSASRSTTAPTAPRPSASRRPGCSPRAAYPPEFTARARSGPTSTAPASMVSRNSGHRSPSRRRTSRGSSSTRPPQALGTGAFGNVAFIQRIDTRGGVCAVAMRRTDGRRGLHRELRVLGTQVRTTPPNRRDGRSSVAAVRRSADLRRENHARRTIRRPKPAPRPFATVWPIPREPECCHPARVLGRRPS